MSAPGNVMILASAGSGKTYALTNRFVELLAAGAQPERIVALTFTRKAAGEFFDEILRKLARAARDPRAAWKLASDIRQPTLQPADFLRMLRAVVDAMPRLRLGTLDSFFARIARTFPLELGLAGEFELLEEHTARSERQRVLQRMFARTGELSGAQQEFMEAFKRATFGTEEKRLAGRLDAFLDEHHEIYLGAPLALQWGDPDRIWGDNYAWRAAKEKISDLIAALRAALRDRGVTEGQAVRWEAFFYALAEWQPGMPLPPALEYILKNALAVWPELRAGRAEMVVERRKFLVEGKVAALLADLIVYVVGGELERHLATTRGIHAVLHAYEGVYHDAVRRAGKLTFSDVQRLLLPGGEVPLLSQNQDAAAGELRMGIDYRLDGQIDHWLLDEFQDTSWGQWQVLRNLIDEALQDATGARSFFCVGDVKQAIYSWREGDHRLFREIFNHYNRAAAGRIVERHLVESWRSGPALVEMVNAVFGSGAVLADLFPREVADDWNREWRMHVSAVPERTGHAALLHANDERDRWGTALRLLQEIRPLERGLTCAILVQKNETARQLADFLRREGGIAAVAESDLQIGTDNPLAAGLLALLQTAAHPGDALSWEHVQMSPLGAILAQARLIDPDTVSRTVLGQIHADGFEATLEFWWKKLEQEISSGDLFTRERSRQITAAAALFDVGGSRSVAEFQQFMTDYSIRGTELASMVRIMTVHKAKGLGFDVVVLPDLEGTKLAQARDGLAVRKAADRSVDWVLDLPPKLFCQSDEVLAEQLKAAEADSCYEKLALLYVAITRAKRAMYVVTEPVGGSRSHNYSRLLGHCLGLESKTIRIGEFTGMAAWTTGQSSWYLDIPFTPRQKPLSETTLAPLPRENRVSVLRRTPRRASAENVHVLAAAPLFSLEGNLAADLGTAIHALLAKVEWGDESGLSESGLSTELEREAMKRALACLRAPQFASVWTRPSSGKTVEVWRERSFEVVLDRNWVTGVFDRVVILRDDRDNALSATVFDFKTNEISDHAALDGAVARYGPQLNLYRRVAAVLLGLEASSIDARLVFTASYNVVSVPLEPL
jgi:ATP-dependent helicase/nuclease subunit A